MNATINMSILVPFYLRPPSLFNKRSAVSCIVRSRLARVEGQGKGNRAERRKANLHR